MSESFKIPLGIPTNGDEEFQWKLVPSPHDHDGCFTTYHGEIRLATLAQVMKAPPPGGLKLASCHDSTGKRRDDLMGAMIARHGTNIIASEWHVLFDKAGPAIVRGLLHEATRGARQVFDDLNSRKSS